MKLVFLSNFYPPFSHGGYEQWCQEVAIELRARGHDVQVITSIPGNRREKFKQDDAYVHRFLHLEIENGLVSTICRQLFDRRRIERSDADKVGNFLTGFQPDAVLVWGMWNLPRSLAALMEELLPGRVTYYICDYWLTLPSAYLQRWQAPSRKNITRLPKYVLSKVFLTQLDKEQCIPLRLEHPICVSNAVKNTLLGAGVPINHALTIYGGVRMEEFSDIPRRLEQNATGITRLVYVGRLTEEKSVLTAIEAIKLIAERGTVSVTLDIIGKGNPDYERQLMAFIQRNHLSGLVRLQGSVPRTQMPELMSQYDALIFPSKWEEPFARTILEAMAAGLVVIGTTTGGTAEILINGETGLTFPAGNAEQLAEQILYLSRDTELQRRLAEAGKKRVLQKHTFEHSVDQIETVLQRIADHHRVSR